MIKRKKPTPIIGPKFVPCAECQDGWVTVWEIGAWGKVPIGKMKRCWCWTHHQQQIQESGR